MASSRRQVRWNTVSKYPIDRSKDAANAWLATRVERSMPFTRSDDGSRSPAGERRLRATADKGRRHRSLEEVPDSFLRAGNPLESLAKMDLVVADGFAVPKSASSLLVLVGGLVSR